MKRFVAALIASAVFSMPLATRADGPSGMPSAAEEPFVKTTAADLKARFSTPADAERAGYVRYTNEDETGAISYANRVWTSIDAKHPSQLWYDVNGRLLGADFSVPYTSTPPHLFGVDPAHWTPFHAHEHYVLAGPNGKALYGATGVKKIVAAGGDPAHPTAANLVSAGIVKDPSAVRLVFEFPAIWDLGVWVLPNANGAFADKNPAVKPVNPPKPGEDM
ncbi:MAG: hypothetical protein IAI49_00065 [Candidatus Eremiobacteraeota bacterium]|nr:hypothetical protein [Candidatus Eremiobacteraeota bacterium]